MQKFLEQAALRGCRPRHLPSLRTFQRLHITTKLLGERSVARFIVAPTGFGKTVAALDYAAEAFSFEHVMWIRGDSPAFICELPKGTLAAQIRGVEPDCGLVVFEDILPMEEGMADLFVQAVDELLDSGCEVLVTCTPTADRYERISDRLVVTSGELLLTDDEILGADVGGREIADVRLVPISQRIAGLALGGGNDAESFLRAVMQEELQSEIALAMFTMLVLGCGSLSDVSPIIKIKSDTLELLARFYKFLGIDEIRGTFEAAPFSCGLLANVFKDRFKVFACRSRLRSEKGLLNALADVLLGEDDTKRACELIYFMARPQHRGEWLCAHQAMLMDECALFSASVLFDRLDPTSQTCELIAGEALRLTLLGERVAAYDAAKRLRKRLASSNDSDPAAESLGALCMIATTAGEAGEESVRYANKIIAAAGSSVADTRQATAAPSQEGEILQERLSALGVAVAMKNDLNAAACKWLDAFDGQRPGRLALILASWLMRQAGAPGGNGRALKAIEPVAATIATAATAEFAERGDVTLPVALAALAFDKLTSAHALALPPLDPDLIAAARRFDDMLGIQRLHSDRRRREIAQVKARKRAVNRDPRITPYSRFTGERPPALTVNLFGAMEIYIGNERVSHEYLSRKKVRLLLALLVMHRGNQLTRESLAKQLYPKSSEAKAIDNVGALKSKLVIALTLPGKSCPYIVQHQGSFGLDASLLRSDVLDVNAVCDSVSRGSLSGGNLECLMERADDMFCDDLLPGYTGVESVEDYRKKYRRKLVEAFIAASGLLIRAGRNSDALKLARAAYDRDRRREDVYYALIESQYACLQTSDAIDTYLECCRFLSEELGLDPSPKTERLYRRMLEAQGVGARELELAR